MTYLIPLSLIENIKSRDFEAKRTSEYLCISHLYLNRKWDVPEIIHFFEKYYLDTPEYAEIRVARAFRRFIHKLEIKKGFYDYHESSHFH